MMLRTIATSLMLTSLLAGCSTFDQLSSIGEKPPLTAIQNPTTQPGYQPVRMPMPAVEKVSYEPNSLFNTNARGFFKDQRAHKVGDILLVQVTISDKAQIDNSTDTSRKTSNAAGVGGILGSILGKVDPGVDPTSAIDITASSGNTGAGSINRSEDVQTQVAAIVTQVLPNGNLVIEGHQEVRINSEVRELIVAGLVRPEDIASDNTIPSSKIAEARISYGGRGQISTVQTPRYGQQVMDAILPF